MIWVNNFLFMLTEGSRSATPKRTESLRYLHESDWPNELVSTQSRRVMSALMWRALLPWGPAPLCSVLLHSLFALAVFLSPTAIIMESLDSSYVKSHIGSDTIVMFLAMLSLFVDFLRSGMIDSMKYARPPQWSKPVDLFSNDRGIVTKIYDSPHKACCGRIEKSLNYYTFIDPSLYHHKTI